MEGMWRGVEGRGGANPFQTNLDLKQFNGKKLRGSGGAWIGVEGLNIDFDAYTYIRRYICYKYTLYLIAWPVYLICRPISLRDIAFSIGIT